MNKCNFIRSISFFALALFIFRCSSTKKTVQAPPPAPKPPVVVETKPAETPKPQPPKPLNFALLLPLDLKNQFVVDTSREAETAIDAASMNQLHFLEGALLAVDSLKQKGIIVNLKTFDTAIDSFSLTNLLYQKDVMNSDCIFASFNGGFYTTAATIAQKHNNKIVFTSPAPASTIKQNKNVYLSVPATATQCSLTVNYIKKNYSDVKIYVVNREVKREKDVADIFKTNFASSPVNYFTWTAAKEDSLLTGFSTTRQNVVIITSSDEAFVSPLLSKINALNMANITIMGLPTWENFESIDFSALKNLNILYFTSSYFDITNGQVLAFRKKFLSKYNTEPLPSAFAGFDLVNYFAKQMAGEKNASQISVSLAPYQFANDVPDNGFENKSIHILQVKDYSLIKKN